MGSTGDRKDTIKALPAAPPMAPCTLSCGWLSRMPSRLWSLWLAACALANPAASVPPTLPAKFAVRNALLMVGSATVDLVVRSRSGLAGVRPRTRLLEEHSRRRGSHRTPKIRRAAQAPLRQHVLLRLRERRKKRGDGRVELRLERIEGRDEGGIVGIEHVVEHGGGDARRLGPIPVGQRELRIAAERADGGLQPSDIGAMPSQKPPVLVRAVEHVDEGIAVPVAGIRGWPIQHFTDAP